MHEHLCGSRCRTVQLLAKLSLNQLRPDIDGVIPVKSWCRVCGVPVLLEVISNYELAVKHFYALDDTPMVHKSVHAEQGGWGVSWRLDDVLFVTFPGEHTEELWPMAPWWTDHYGPPESEDQGVLVLTAKDLRHHRDNYMDMELRMLDNYINREPKSREDLLQSYEGVFSAKEVDSEFEILGFKNPFAIARCKKTGARGSLIFQNTPRFYFGWDPERLI